MPTETLSAKWLGELVEKYELDIGVVAVYPRIKFKPPMTRWAKSSPQFPTTWITWGLGIKGIVYKHVPTPNAAYFDELERVYRVPTYASKVEKPQTMADLFVVYQP